MSLTILNNRDSDSSPLLGFELRFELLFQDFDSCDQTVMIHIKFFVSFTDADCESASVQNRIHCAQRTMFIPMYDLL